VRLKFASLRQSAIVEDADLRAPRGIDRAFFAKLVDGDWIGRKQNLLITGPTGVGVISSKSSTITTSADRPSSPVRCRSSIGTRSSPTPSPMPSSTASVDNAHRLALKGDSMRKIRPTFQS
jgi:hypothetical protein